MDNNSLRREGGRERERGGTGTKKVRRKERIEERLKEPKSKHLKGKGFS